MDRSSCLHVHNLFAWRIIQACSSGTKQRECWKLGLAKQMNRFKRLVTRNRFSKDEPTWRCRRNPFIGAVGIQQPVIPGEPLIKNKPIARRTPRRTRDSVFITRQRTCQGIDHRGPEANKRFLMSSRGRSDLCCWCSRFQCFPGVT